MTTNIDINTTILDLVKERYEVGEDERDITAEEVERNFWTGVMNGASDDDSPLVLDARSHTLSPETTIDNVVSGWCDGAMVFEADNRSIFGIDEDEKDDDVVRARVEETVAELIDQAVDDIVDAICDDRAERALDVDEFVAELLDGWDAAVFELDGEDDDWEGFIRAVAEAVAEARMDADDPDDVRAEDIADEIDAADYRA